MKRIVKKFLILVFWIAIWQAVAMIVDSPLLLPTPAMTALSFVKLLGDGGFYLDALATIGRCALAIVLAVVFGAVLSGMASKWQIVRDLLSLPVAMFKAVPIMAVAIYMLFLLTAGNVPTLVCFIMCFPIVYTNLLAGLDAMNPEYLEMAKVYGLDRASIARHIYIPSLLPYFKSAVSIICGISWKAVVTAEVLSVPEFSLGYELMNAKYYLETDTLFAYVIAIILIAICCERLINMALRKLDRKEYSKSKIRRRSGSASSEGREKISTSDNANINKDNNTKEGGLNDSSDGRLEVSNLYKAFGDKIIFSDYSLRIGPGERVGLMAVSGSGKTTLLRIICGLTQVDAGTVNSPRNISVLFQEDRLLPWLNIYDNLALVNDDIIKINKLLEAVGLEDEKFSLPEQLSGGMCHRVAMARAFLFDAKLMIFDEPFRGLDEETRAEVIEKLWKPGIEGRTVLLITHDPELAKELTDRIETL